MLKPAETGTNLVLYSAAGNRPATHIGANIALTDKNWLRHAARVVLGGLILLFLGMLLRREIDRGWGDIFIIGHGRWDLLPLAAAAILTGLTYGKKGLRLAAQAILVGAVFLFLGRAIHEDWGQITGRAWHFKIPWMAASLILMSSLYLSQASGWLLILKRFGHQVPLLPGVFVWSKSLLARYVPGNVLMVVGRVVMIEPFGVPKRVSFTSVIYEQSLLAAASASVVSIALPLWPALRGVSPLIWLILLIPPMAVMGLHPRVFGSAANFLLKKVRRQPIEEFLPFRTVIAFVGYYALTLILSGLGLYSLVRAVTMISFSDLPIVIASAPLAWLLALFVFISPSGLGVREGVYTFTLAFAFNHESGVASAFAILARFWQTMIEVSFALTVMLLAKKFHRSRQG